jgi:predicted lysophospholipase L1 biosynthesis ABC-type transport system permease subunit
MLSCLLEACLLVSNWSSGYLLGGVLTTLLLAILLRSELQSRSDRPTLRDVAKTVALWPAAIAMASLFAIITIGNRFWRWS